MPPGFLNRKRGKHKPASADPWAHNLEYQRELAFMRGAGGLAAPVTPLETVPPVPSLSSPPRSLRRVRSSAGGIPFFVPAYVPPGVFRRDYGFDESVALLHQIPV